MESQNSLSHETNRLFAIDHIRLFIIILVVIVHANVTYSGFGRWFIMDDGGQTLASSLIFGIFNSFSQAYFMGFLFLIAGYFTPRSYNKKGIKLFIKDRFTRLGLPTLFFMFFVGPLTRFLVIVSESGNLPNVFKFYTKVVFDYKIIGRTGPMWFTLALLFFSIIYALLRHYVLDHLKTQNRPYEIGHQNVILTILLITVIAFLIRLVQPIGTAIFNMQLCFFAQYILLFYIGLAAYKHNWLNTLSFEFGIKWFKLGIGIGLPFWLAIMLLGGFIEGKDYLYFGGMYWQSLAYTLWESFYCIAMVLGLTVIFRDKLSKRNNITQFMSDNAFGVYVFHTPVLVLLTVLFRSVLLPPLLKALVVICLAIPLSFLTSHFIRKSKAMRKLLV